MNYSEKPSLEMITQQPPPKEGIPGSDAWLDGIHFAEGFYSAMPFVTQAATALVLQDMVLRRAMGIKKYGCPLQYATNRDNVIDGYQEDLDGYVYGTAALNSPKGLSPLQRSKLEHVRRMRLEILTIIRTL